MEYNCPENELVNCAKKLVNDSKLDFVIANDLAQIKEDSHVAHIINKSGYIKKVESKQEIAGTLLDVLEKHFNTTK